MGKEGYAWDLETWFISSSVSLVLQCLPSFPILVQSSDHLPFPPSPAKGPGRECWRVRVSLGAFEALHTSISMPKGLWHERVNRNHHDRASLVAQWLRVCLPMQGTRVRALVWEDPTCCGATGPMSHNYWACASGACAPQQERPR